MELDHGDGHGRFIGKEVLAKIMKQQCIYILVCGYRYCLVEILRRVCNNMRVVNVTNIFSCHQMYG